MNLSELAATGRTPPAPCEVELGAIRLDIEHWLRVLPGQRYVARARWQGQTVLAKLLVGRKAAKRHRAELTGAQLLAAQHLPTPLLRDDGFIAGQGGWLLFDWLHDAHSLQQEWHDAEPSPPTPLPPAGEGRAALPSPAQRTLLADALATIATLHRCGLWQADLHLENLLRQGDTLYLIDAGSVRTQTRAETPGQPLSKRRAIANLALFFAQLPPRLESCLAGLLAHYLVVNFAHDLPPDRMLAAIARQRRRRLRNYLKKSTRDCSLFAARVNACGLQIVRRDETPQLLPLLTQLDAQITSGHVYKTGGSASVARIAWQGRALVLKRYNVKNFRHWLRRCWRPSRAVHSWREAHRLELLAIATPRPLAVIEERRWGLRQRAYLITEHCDGPDLLAYFANPQHGAPSVAPSDPAIVALVQLLEDLIRARVSHGDLKGHNLIWRDGHWWLIDLDAMRQHASLRTFARAYARDRARLLRNFPQESALHRLLDARLPWL